jgi:alkanesulfonate monooxygenase SsuD/methylene tetrahydromethanopterin reductase-like flavin-dependent oxidoreductase (luciferase family)
VQVSARPYEAALFGRRAVPPAAALADRDDPATVAFLGGLLAEAADYVEVLRRLWDSWEDGAEIRDAATGRFIDRDKLHYIDFAGDYFAVRGPSITPRPPQGQPVVMALSHGGAAGRLAAGSADVAFVTPRDAAGARASTAQIRLEQEAAGRAGPRHVLADLVVFLDRTAAAATARQARLDEQAGGPYRSDAAVFAGTPGDLADLLLDWQASGLSGFRLRPGTIPGDLHQVTGLLVPELQRRGAFRRGYEAATLRGLLGLPRPASRYASAAASTREVPS